MSIALQRVPKQKSHSQDAIEGWENFKRFFPTSEQALSMLVIEVNRFIKAKKFTKNGNNHIVLKEEQASPNMVHRFFEAKDRFMIEMCKDSSTVLAGTVNSRNEVVMWYASRGVRRYNADTIYFSLHGQADIIEQTFGQLKPERQLLNHKHETASKDPEFQRSHFEALQRMCLAESLNLMVLIVEYGLTQFDCVVVNREIHPSLLALREQLKGVDHEFAKPPFLRNKIVRPF